MSYRIARSSLVELRRILLYACAHALCGGACGFNCLKITALLSLFLSLSLSLSLMCVPAPAFRCVLTCSILMLPYTPWRCGACLVTGMFASQRA